MCHVHSGMEVEEDQEFKISLHYIAGSKPPCVTWDPDSKRKIFFKKI